jgi:hypothetical protein
MATVLGTLFIYLTTLGVLLFTAYGSLLCWSSHFKEPTLLLKKIDINLRFPFTLLAEGVIHEIKSQGNRRFLFVRGIAFRLVTTVPCLFLAFGILYSGLVLMIDGDILSGILVQIICTAMIIHTIFAWTFGKRLIRIEKRLSMTDI